MKLPGSVDIFEETLTKLQLNCADLIVKHAKDDLTIIYFGNLADPNLVNSQLLSALQHIKLEPFTMEDLCPLIPVGLTVLTCEMEQAITSLLRGWTVVYKAGYSDAILVNTAKPPERTPSIAEIETNVIGPQIGFTESIETNLGIVRSYIANENLCNESLEIGVKTKTQVQLLYLSDVAEEQTVNTLRQRITDLEIDGVIGSSLLVQFIEDNSMSIFPQLILTERPDRVGFSLLEGKVVLLVNGSNFAIVGPSTFLDFFKSPEDHYLHWNIAVFIRGLRFLAIFISILMTPAYVAALTFHYEVIPPSLLVPLAQSRSKVPFPPLFESLFLEITIELLREAGARLPTKVGQTMGIVGGIVIGQAAVQAGFTSNILIMIVALAALSSFTTPIYLMGISIRFVRFPMIITAGIWGGIGIVFTISLLIIHLLRQTSLGHPYLHPIFPPRWRDLMDTVFRLPFPMLSGRSTFTRMPNKQRFNKEQAKQKKDIDE
ncbi:spore germination protein [Paenibacillus marchantiophytorum]|uniref:Spore germination protein n=1 Tax=Paenibacillus marchantiophytorum TaxID=1619310 RepID=A0ABQ1EV33_9BACL|nr:spore germination protein [Paenibacillus marchantiophytorum]GFZ88702.1 spore germination protein [Paenibacillus marchantiophytorum]